MRVFSWRALGALMTIFTLAALVGCTGGRAPAESPTPSAPNATTPAPQRIWCDEPWVAPGAVWETQREIVVFGASWAPGARIEVGRPARSSSLEVVIAGEGPFLAAEDDARRLFGASCDPPHRVLTEPAQLYSGIPTAAAEIGGMELPRGQHILVWGVEDRFVEVELRPGGQRGVLRGWEVSSVRLELIEA